MYHVRITADTLSISESIHGTECASLTGGIARTIAGTYAHLARIDERRAQDFVHGLCLALTHVTLTQKVPVVVPG